MFLELTMQRLPLVSFLVFIVMAEVESKLAENIDSFDLIIRTMQPAPSNRHQYLADLRIIHVTSKLRKSYKMYSNLSRIYKDKYFDVSRPTVLYIHGYVELTTDESVKTIEKAYLDNGGYNLLILDWSNLAFGNYFYAATNVEPVSRAVGKALTSLCRFGLRSEGIHLVGHSLGAHIAGGIARVMREDGIKILRITGLDPAGPLFHPSIFGLRPISEEDGEFVDIIHTDGSRYGTLVPSGDVDYYPNGGLKDQPGCPRKTILFTKEDFCSHHRSWRFFAEIVSGGPFEAVKCDSYEEFLNHSCDRSKLIVMGENIRLRGKFYLRTNSRSPFALAIDGVK